VHLPDRGRRGGLVLELQEQVLPVRVGIGGAASCNRVNAAR
jgi:hypothetical protein